MILLFIYIWHNTGSSESGPNQRPLNNPSPIPHSSSILLTICPALPPNNPSNPPHISHPTALLCEFHPAVDKDREGANSTGLAMAVSTISLTHTRDHNTIAQNSDPSLSLSPSESDPACSVSLDDAAIEMTAEPSFQSLQG